MIKRLITTLSLTCLALGIHAESKYMTVEKTDGSSISFLLNDNPVITYQSGNLEINKDSKTTYAFDMIKDFHFTETDESGTRMFSADVLRFIWIDNETIEVQNTQPGTVVFLTAINGVVVSKSKADADGKATIKMPQKAGVYVISAGKQSFKIIRKL